MSELEGEVGCSEASEGVQKCLRARPGMAVELCALEGPAGLVKTPIAGPTLKIPDSVGEVGPEGLHVEQAPRCRSCWPRDHGNGGPHGMEGELSGTEIRTFEARVWDGSALLLGVAVSERVL